MTSPCSRTNTNATTFHCSPCRNKISSSLPIASQPALNHHQPANFGSVGQSSSGCWKSESCQSEVSFRLCVFFSFLFSRSTFRDCPFEANFQCFSVGESAFFSVKSVPGCGGQSFTGFSRWKSPGEWLKIGQNLGKFRGGTHSRVCVPNWTSKLVRFSACRGHFDTVRGRAKWWKVKLGKVRQVLIRIRDLF